MMHLSFYPKVWALNGLILSYLTTVVSGFKLTTLRSLDVVLPLDTATVSSWLFTKEQHNWSDVINNF